MPADRGTGYTLGFAALVCLVCSILVTSTALALKDRQEANRLLDLRRNVLVAAGKAEPGERLTPEQVDLRFGSIQALVLDRRTAELQAEVSAASFDARWEEQNPATSLAVSDNPAGLSRLPDRVLVYQVCEAGRLQSLILPVQGKGLWSTLYGFLALGADTSTIGGVAFYQHAETPGLGGEVDNQRWRERWKERQAFDQQGQPRIEVIKGKAGSPADDPHRVDGLSGATLTTNGVTNLVQFWLGDEGYGPYLEQVRAGGGEPCR